MKLKRKEAAVPKPHDRRGDGSDFALFMRQHVLEAGRRVEKIVSQSREIDDEALRRSTIEAVVGQK